MDGTGDLFARFAEAWTGPPLTVIRYDVSMRAPYPSRPVPLPEGPCVLVAESYSGPIAVHLASAPNVLGLVLCCTFVTSPAPRGLRGMAALASRLPLPRSPPAGFVSRWMVGPHADERLVAAVRGAARQVAPGVFRQRLRDVVRVDARDALREVRCPILVLQARQDQIVPERCAQEIRRLRPDAHHRHIHGPHLLLQARPAPCAEEIQRFVLSVGPAV